MDTQSVIITSEPSGFKHKKLLVVLLTTAVVFLLTGGIIYLFQSKVPPKQGKLERPQLIRKTQLSQLKTEGHSSVFYVILEYDQKTGTITQLTSGETNADLTPLSPLAPTTSPTNFTYKIEVVSETDELLYTGWKSVSKKILTTPKNTLKFRLTSPYYPNAIIKLYLPQETTEEAALKPVWTGKIL